MKKILAILPVLLMTTAVFAATDCNTIQDQTILYSAGHFLAGEPLMIGYDPYGYNYQAHMFKGSFFNVYAGGAGYAPYEGEDVEYLTENPGADTHWAWPYREDQIVMKWNDAWLSNKDCDDDGKLDRSSPYIGSGAWETNHQWGVYEYEDALCKWDYFVKIIAAPSYATPNDGVWYAPDGTEIGPVIWGSFAIIQEVYTDSCTEDHGLSYNSPTSAGFGYYMP